MTAGARGVLWHPLFGQSVLVRMARLAGGGLCEIMRLVTIGACTVTRREQERTRDQGLVLAVAAITTALCLFGASVVMLMTAAAGLISAEPEIPVAGNHFLMTARAAVGLCLLLCVGRVAALTGSRAMDLDCR